MTRFSENETWLVVAEDGQYTITNKETRQRIVLSMDAYYDLAELLSSLLLFPEKKWNYDTHI